MLANLLRTLPYMVASLIHSLLHISHLIWLSSDIRLMIAYGKKVE